MNLVLRAATVYVAVLVLLRVSGKRQLGQMGATEFVALLLISNAVQNAMNGGDNSLGAGLLLAVVLIFLSWAVSELTYRSRRFQAIFEGTPTLLVHKGKPLARNLARERMTMTDLRTLLRKQGVEHIHEVGEAVLEADGSLSVTRETHR
jgi:uncharacterized membrane protein YcaP (DUF421 family)